MQRCSHDEHCVKDEEHLVEALSDGRDGNGNKNSIHDTRDETFNSP